METPTMKMHFFGLRERRHGFGAWEKGRPIMWQRCTCRYWIVAVALLACTGNARADDTYYLLIFGAQTTPPRMNYSHSTATFVRVSGAPGQAKVLESHT